MKRSTNTHIRTTHTGSLPRPADMLDTMRAMAASQPYDEKAYEAALTKNIAEIVKKQVDAGIDVVTDGECSKPSFQHYVAERLDGFEPRMPAGGLPVPTGPICPDDSHVVRGKCVCDSGSRGTPGNCRPVVTGNPPIVVTPVPTGPICPKDSHVVRGRCVCDAGTAGRPGNCQPIVGKPTIPVCPRDSHWNVRTKSCVCDTGTRGKPGNCQPAIR